MLLATMLFAAPAALAVGNPLGGTGNAGQWKPEWTKTFKECFDDAKNSENLKKVKPKDEGDYCGGIPPNDYRYWLSIFIPLAGKESNFNPQAHGQNGKRTPEGLFQMDAEDMKNHKCNGGDPRDVKMSVCCAIKIADDQSKKNQVIAQSSKGILADFWQPMKDGMGGNGRGKSNVINNSKNHTDIKEESKKLCTSEASKLSVDGAGSSPALQNEKRGGAGATQ